MSKSESFNSDFRTLANKALERLGAITTNLHDTIHARLVREGAITVLVSLLSNEAGALQQMSCTVLANLFCWESLQVHDRMEKSLSDQIRACDGVKILASLLTSPSASINLAGNFSKGKTTSSIQGMCSKEASRALITLFCGQHPPSPPRRDCGKGVFMHELILAEFPIVRAWYFLYFHKSGSVKDAFTCYLHVSAKGMLQGRGSDEIGFFILNGENKRDIDGGVWRFDKRYVSEQEISQGEGLESWLLQVGGGEDDSASMLNGRSHVSHVAYYCDGDDWGGLGLYGVWETAQSSQNAAHFLLEKGGVFRAFPIF